MKSRFTALALAGCLLLSLCACGAQDAGPSAAPSLSVQPSLEAEVLPSAAPSQDAEDVLAPASDAPVESGAPNLPPATPEASQAPGEQPGETNLGAMPGGIVSSPVPSEAPSDEPFCEEVYTAAGLRDAFMVTSSQSDAPTSGFADMSDYLSDFYNLDAADLEDFVFYMPEMSTALQEFFLAKAKPGKVEDVKAACQSRLDGLKEDAQFYPGTAEFVDAAKVETVGDWVVLAVCPEGSRMAKILQDRVQ